MGKRPISLNDDDFTKRVAPEAGSLPEGRKPRSPKAKNGHLTHSFEIDIDNWIPSNVGDPEVQETVGEIIIKVNNYCVTELEDRRAKTVRKSVRASALQLASWLVSNWWRLRWEPDKESVQAELGSVDWELSHSMPAAGGGYVWPPLTLASDGQRILLKCDGLTKNDDSTLAPIRYLNSFFEVVEPASFESGVTDFVERVIARLDSTGYRKSVLHELWSEVSRERKNQALTSRRKLEALMGIDPDDNPDLVSRLLKWQPTVGKGALEEIAAACESQNVEAILGTASDATKSVKTYAEISEPRKIRELPVFAESNGPKAPWKRGQEAAYAIRQIWGFGMDPIKTSAIADRLQISESKLQEVHSEISFSLAVRGPSEDKFKLILNRKHEPSRRFDVARLIGDHIFMNSGDQWRPATRSFTARQKFQRAFAAEFLCPSDELLRRYNGPFGFDDLDEITLRIAEDYKVSQQVVMHHLANRGQIPRLMGSDGDFPEPLHSIGG